MRCDLLDRALCTLRDGGTILYPTDTIWGIGCDACLPEAVERVYAIKERDRSKSMLVLALPEMLSPTLPKEAWHLLSESSTPTTVILPQNALKVTLSSNLPAQDGSIGVRIPQFAPCTYLLNQLGHPLVSTSANLSGRPTAKQYDQIENEVIKRVDYALPDDESFQHPQTESSRIVKLETDGSIVLIRG